MKILVIVPDYPYPDYPFSGIFNERSVLALGEFCDTVEVLAPHPYAPPILSSLVPRWRTYRGIERRETRNRVLLERPAYVQIPQLGGAFWTDPGAYFCCRGTARKMHRRAGFDAIISYDLVGAGGMAWRIGRDLDIPASGWATGGDVRSAVSSSHRRVLLRAARNLDLVFYQSHELQKRVAELLGTFTDLRPNSRHIVLPRGIPETPRLHRMECRNRIRSQWRIQDDQVVILNIGRIVREKGVFELMDAIALAAAKDPKIICVLVGSKPDVDETRSLKKKLDKSPILKERVRLLPSCEPDKVWELLCAADIFAFPSHEEGMPNSLLEAMAMGVPAVAFAIPPVVEIDGGKGALLTVPPLNVRLLAEAVLELVASENQRVRLTEKARARVMDRFMVRKNMKEALSRLTTVVEERKYSHFSGSAKSA